MGIRNYMKRGADAGSRQAAKREMRAARRAARREAKIAAKRTRREAKTAQAKASITARSDGHITFAHYEKEGRDLVLRRVDDDAQVQPGDLEYFASPSGLGLHRCKVDAPIVKKKIVGNEKYGPANVREDETLVATGTVLIEEFCRKLRVPLPPRTSEIKAAREAVVDKFKAANRERRAASRGSAATNKKPDRETKMKGKNGKSIAESWSELFIDNERLAKQKKALSDDQLRARMTELFPDRAESRAIKNVQRQRMLYNDGRYRYAKFGKAGSKDRPKSLRYDDGKTGLTREEAKAKDKAAKKAAKNAAKDKAKPPAKPAKSKSAPAKAKPQKAKPAAHAQAKKTLKIAKARPSK